MEFIKFFMTNNHALERKDIIIGKNIKISIKIFSKIKEIIIDKFRKAYKNELFDIIIIEIKQINGIILRKSNQIGKKKEKLFINFNQK